jgi:hypothetical protein
MLDAGMKVPNIARKLNRTACHSIPLDLQRQELKEQACLLKWLHNSSLRRCDRGINSTLFLDISFFLDRNIVLGL